MVANLAKRKSPLDEKEKAWIQQIAGHFSTYKDLQRFTGRSYETLRKLNLHLNTLPQHLLMTAQDIELELENRLRTKPHLPDPKKNVVSTDKIKLPSEDIVDKLVKAADTHFANTRFRYKDEDIRNILKQYIIDEAEEIGVSYSEARAVAELYASNRIKAEKIKQKEIGEFCEGIWWFDDGEKVWDDAYEIYLDDAKSIDYEDDWAEGIDDLAKEYAARD